MDVSQTHRSLWMRPNSIWLCNVYEREDVRVASSFLNLSWSSVDLCNNDFLRDFVSWTNLNKSDTQAKVDAISMLDLKPRFCGLASLVHIVIFGLDLQWIMSCCRKLFDHRSRFFEHLISMQRVFSRKSLHQVCRQFPKLIMADDPGKPQRQRVTGS